MSSTHSFVWYDTNDDGIQEGSEPNAPGVTVTLTGAGLAPPETTTTNTSGYYDFTGLELGQYTISFTPVAGYTFSTPPNGQLTQTLSSGETDTNANAGLYAPVATTTTLTSSGPSMYGQAVTFTATVTSASGTPTGGIVTFEDAGTALGSAALSGGVATFSTTALSAATHSITAVYGGFTPFTTSSSGAVSQVVSPAPLTVTANAQEIVIGSAIAALTFTYSGLVNGDTSGVFSGALAPAATATSPVGVYPIMQGTLTAGANYAVSSTGADLTVVALPVVTVGAPTQTLAEGAAGTITVSRSGGLVADPLTVDLTIGADGAGDPLAIWDQDDTLSASGAVAGRPGWGPAAGRGRSRLG